MFRFPEGFFFKPSQSIEEILPILAGISIAVFIAISIACIGYLVKNHNRRSRDLLRFRAMAKRYGLNRKEQLTLLTLADWTHVEKRSQILTNAERFERMLRAMERKGYFARRALKKYNRTISFVREKLFGRAIAPTDQVTTTKQLRAGTRLFMRYIDYADTVVWGHLIDVDNEGLVVVVPLNRNMKIPLRKETTLEITAYIANHDPVAFNTMVKEVIPGPRRMVVLEHSSNVIKRSPKSPSIQDHDYPVPDIDWKNHYPLPA